MKTEQGMTGASSSTLVLGEQEWGSKSGRHPRFLQNKKMISASLRKNIYTEEAHGHGTRKNVVAWEMMLKIIAFLNRAFLPPSVEAIMESQAAVFDLSFFILMIPNLLSWGQTSSTCFAAWFWRVAFLFWEWCWRYITWKENCSWKPTMFYEHVWWATLFLKTHMSQLHIFSDVFLSYPEQQSCFIMMLLNICMNSNMHGCCILFHPHSKETWYMIHVSVNCLIASRQWKENAAMHSSFVPENRLDFKGRSLHDTGSVWLRLDLELDLGLVYNFPKCT